MEKPEVVEKEGLEPGVGLENGGVATSVDSRPEQPPQPPAAPAASTGDKKEEFFHFHDPVSNQDFTLKKPTVNVKDLRLETKVVATAVAGLITRITEKEAVITNAVRTVEEQQEMMDWLKKTYGQDYYDHIYGRWERSGGKVEDLPHVDRRAVDFRYIGFEEAIPAIQELNDEYAKRVHFVIGYVPSTLVVIESKNCFHVQTARGITDQNRQAYFDFVRTLISKL